MLPTLAETLAADRPGETPADDTLGRAPFAERIAREFAAALGRPGLIASLSGDPGAGKTTLKNFVRHYLATNGIKGGPGALVIEFAPWATGGPHALAAAFFRDVAAQLAARAEPALKELARAWEKFGAAFVGDESSKKPAESPRAAQEALRAQFQSLWCPVVLAIDDVDRLEPAEIRQLLRLLKNAAAFPNLITLLLYQRSVIVEALGEDRAESGDEYLRKLVQVELELPEAPEQLLRKQLESGLTTIIGEATFPARPRERWNDVMSTAVWPLFSTPRDVKRFLGAFAFQFGQHFNATERVLEVNPIDLVLVETLRMFAHPVFVELRDTFRRRETRLVRLMSGRDEERKEARVEIDRFVEALPFSDRKKRILTAALQQLVPLGAGGGHGNREDWDRDLRLCSPRHVERYFHLGAVVECLPAHRLVAIARAAGDREKLEKLLLEAVQQRALPEVLERLPALLDHVTEPQVPMTVAALCSLCDQIPADAPAGLEGRLVKLATDLFALLKNPLQRENVVGALLDDANQLTGPILLLHQLRPRSDVLPVDVLTVEQFRRVMKPAAARLRDAAISAQMWKSREYGFLIRRWLEWCVDKNHVREWLLEQVKEPERARAWLRTFLEPSPAGPREMILQCEELGQLCDPAALAASAAQPGGDGLDRATARTLAQALNPKGTTAGFALRTLVVKLETEL